ncbi:MAG: thioredoxin fold domain-containing protein [Chitinophagaceae bacterium]|nr:thioredoxin fold domain-containing protein [Chitinophagaceae bacterium]
MAAAKILKKPLMLDFTGINCVNCREFESKIWVNGEVMKRMKNDFVVASLFCDYDDEELPDTEKFYSDLLGAKVETVGDKNEHFQQKLIRASGQPNYVFINTDEKLLAPQGYGYDATKGPQDFIDNLEKVKAAFLK